MDNEKFGKFIKELRLKNNMTQKDLATKLNLTDKAISKWERGLSFPDITMLNLLAEIFNVDVSEILNSEYGKKENLDIESIVNERLNKIKDKEEKKKIRINKIKKILGIISFILAIIFLILQLGYIFVLSKYDYEYIWDQLLYIVNEVIILFGTISIICLGKKLKMKYAISTSICILLTFINILFGINNTSKTTSIIDFSKNFSNILVIKQDKFDGKATVYKNLKFIVFARPKDNLEGGVNGKIKTHWITSDICCVTYIDNKDMVREYVATYGDRGDGSSYYYVKNAINGEWQNFSQDSNITTLRTNSNGITIFKNGNKEEFLNTDCEQFGTIALVLYKGSVPKYVISLNENCELDEKTDIIKKGGTINLTEVSMDRVVTEELNCIIHKDDNLENYRVIDLDKYEYKIKDSILYIRYDDNEIKEVPGNFSDVQNQYTEYNYQISDYKTMFFNKVGDKKYLIYSDDKGENWNKVEISNKYSIVNIHFINKNLGFMLEFEDIAMGDAIGSIMKTTDGGKTWEAVYYGIENKNDKIFKTSSNIYFLNENIGFLTMPDTNGEYCKLYITTDGGETFNLVNIEFEQNNIYDYYNLPKLEGNRLLNLVISQGADGDYNGGNSKVFYSYDEGKSWNLYINSKDTSQNS